MDKNISTISKYIATQPKNIRLILQQIRTVIQKTAPLAQETMSYGLPTFDLNKKHLVHFAAFKNHIGFYPTPPAIVFFATELVNYKTSKGAIQFPLTKPIPYALIKKIVKWRTTHQKIV